MIYRKLKVVCFGGGTGLPALLSGLKNNPWLEITALVTMMDNGGSSRELKDRFGILPPGDILKCLLALSEDEAFARKLLLHRIQNHTYDGHTAGNILLLGLDQVFEGLVMAIDALGQTLSIKGKVIPITLGKSMLCANYSDGSCNCGETEIDDGVRQGKTVTDLFLEPRVSLLEQARETIASADAICIGPGSLYTSVLSTFLPDGVTQALASARGKIIYIANLLTEGKGMNGLALEDVVEFVDRRIGRHIDYVVANKHLPTDNAVHAQYAAENKYPIRPRGAYEDSPFVFANLWLDHKIARHDSSRLASLVSTIVSNSLLDIAPSLR
jgi:uncharacterized cofD-like protein